MASGDTIHFSRNQVRPISFLVYLAGIEVPAISVSRQWDLGSFPTLIIEMVPDRTLQRIGAEDKLPVAVFYLDTHAFSEPKFCKFFDGYVAGWSYNNSGSSRSISLVCYPHEKVLHEIYPSFMTSLSAQAVGVLANQPSTIPLPTAGMTFPAALLYTGLNPHMQDGQPAAPIKRPFDILENAVRAVAGLDEVAALGAPLTSTFFTRYIRRHNLINRMIPCPLLETDSRFQNSEGVFPVLGAVRSSNVLAVLQQRLASFGDSASVWEAIQGLFSQLFYEVLLIPSSPIVQTRFIPDTQRGQVLGPPKWLYGDATRKSIVEGTMHGTITGAVTAAATPNRMLECVTKPQAIFGIPPTCNVVFPSMIRALTFSESYDEQPTRVYMGDTQIVTMLHPNTDVLRELSLIRIGYPTPVQDELNRMSSVDGKVGNVFLSGKNFLLWPEEYFRGPKVVQEEIPDWFWYLDEVLRIDVEDVNERQNIRKSMSESFAHYEFVRKKGASRRGGVAMAFNPYVIPGFPTMIFDGLTTNHHLHAYAVGVVDTLTSRSAETNMTFAFAQTIDELMHGVVDAHGDYPLLGSAPPIPIAGIRNVFQVPAAAEDFYALLLKQNLKSGNPVQTAAFDYRKALQLVLPSGEKVSLLNEAALKSGDYLSRYSKTEPTAEYQSFFETHDSAMTVVSRPVCTLEEYIDFHRNGTREGVVEALTPRLGKGARYYKKIMNYSVGPGPGSPSVDENNVLTAPFDYDLRADWPARLELYRARVLETVGPLEG